MTGQFDSGTEKLRKTAHDAVDVAVEAIAGALQTVGAAIGGAEPAPEPLVSSTHGAVRPPRPVPAGERIEVRVALANDNEESTEPFELKAADLVSGGGDRIPADAVELAPQQRVVAAQSEDTVAVTVAVPEGTPPGDYTGEIQATNGAVAPAPLTVHVA